jgi:hypothetical protein
MDGTWSFGLLEGHCEYPRTFSLYDENGTRTTPAYG